MSNEQTAIVSVEEQIKQQLALQASKSAEISGKANFVSFKGGQLIIDNTPIPGGEVDVIVLAQQAERSYYSDDYNPDKPNVPTCYSFDQHAPHPLCAEPQCATCEECPHNKWGSASRGKGKACRESARVAILPASAPLQAAPMYQCSFPITSVPSVRDFFARCDTSGKLSGQFVTKLKVVPDAKSFFKASLAPQSVVEDIDLALLLERMSQARKQLVEPYPVFEEAEPAPKGKSSKKY